MLSKIKPHPHKYYAGLTRKQAAARQREIAKFGSMDWRNPAAYVGFKTDRFAHKTRKSSYTAEWNRLFPGAKSLEARSKATGVPVRFLKESYDRAMAAWRTGHRPGMTPQAWAYPRVSSMLLCGKTHWTADADLVAAAKRVSPAARRWWTRRKAAGKCSRKAAW